MNIPVFPLPIFILPGGVSRIWVFEPRYLRMVAIAMKNNGFAVLPYSKVLTIDTSNIASHVDIINFNQEDDGTLIIDVKCKSLVNVSSMTTDADGLRHADVKKREHWQNELPYTNLAISSDIFQTVYKQYDHLQELYQSPDYQNDIWVVSRWIELLPIDLEVKVAFFNADTFTAACQLLDEILIRKKSDPKQTSQRKS